MRRSLVPLFPLFSLVAIACSSSNDEGAAGSSEDAVTGTCATPPDPSRSLFVTDGANAVLILPMMLCR